MGKLRYLIILNPAAGKGRAGKAKPEIESLMAKHDLAYEIVLTSGVGDAIKIARDASLDADTAVIAAGGDGTSNEVVNGLLTRGGGAGEEPPLFGILPVGRGNDFSYTVGIGNDLKIAVEALKRRNITRLDVGFVKGGFFPEGRYYINGCSMGFDTIVGFAAAKMKHIHSGIAYACGAIKVLAGFTSSPEIQIEIDGETHVMETVICSVMNGRRLGGSFFMAPRARLDDGLLDLCAAKHRSRPALVKIMMHYFKGNQAACGNVLEKQVREIKLVARTGSMAIHADGETVCVEGKEISIKACPAALRLISGGGA